MSTSVCCSTLSPFIGQGVCFVESASDCSTVVSRLANQRSSVFGFFAPFAIAGCCFSLFRTKCRMLCVCALYRPQNVAQSARSSVFNERPATSAMIHQTKVRCWSRKDVSQSIWRHGAQEWRCRLIELELLTFRWPRRRVSQGVILAVCHLTIRVRVRTRPAAAAVLLLAPHRGRRGPVSQHFNSSATRSLLGNGKLALVRIYHPR
jgi:hypothetical protein